MIVRVTHTFDLEFADEEWSDVWDKSIAIMNGNITEPERIRSERSFLEVMYNWPDRKAPVADAGASAVDQREDFSIFLDDD